jgi:aminoglycoside phosphotransferase (APT) family kinase protein
MDDARPNVSLDAPLVRRLVRGQFPHWADREVTPLATAGTDNAIWRLGDDLAVRLPLRESAVPQVASEQRWLPRLAPHLPLAIPEPLGAGAPGEGYPWPWSVCRWLDGQDAAHAGVPDLLTAASDLGGFLTALRAIDASDGPRAGRANHGRGLPLALLDARVRRDVAQLAGEIDAAATLDAWAEALAAPAWDGPGAWLHGDLHPSNLLVRDGRIVAVLDFGLLGVGDPAADLFVGWSLLDAPARAVFRATAGADEAMWARGRGWAVFNAVIALAFYRDTNPVLCRMARRTLAEIALADLP